MQDINEADWKLLRQLHPLALERYCHTILEESLPLHHLPSQSAHRRFLSLCAHFQEGNHKLAWLFDDMRRSQAIRIITRLRRGGLMTDDEFARFSTETRHLVAVILGLK